MTIRQYEIDNIEILDSQAFSLLSFYKGDTQDLPKDIKWLRDDVEQIILGCRSEALIVSLLFTTKTTRTIFMR
jgi:hypothetical protein